MKRALALVVVLGAGALVAGCASARVSGQANVEAGRAPAAFETGWQRPDPTGTNLFKPALSRGDGVHQGW